MKTLQRTSTIGIPLAFESIVIPWKAMKLQNIYIINYWILMEPSPAYGCLAIVKFRQNFRSCLAIATEHCQERLFIPNPWSQNTNHERSQYSNQDNQEHAVMFTFMFRQYAKQKPAEYYQPMSMKYDMKWWVLKLWLNSSSYRLKDYCGHKINISRTCNHHLDIIFAACQRVCRMCLQHILYSNLVIPGIMVRTLVWGTWLWQTT